MILCQKQSWVELLLFSNSVLSESLRTLELQHTRLSCPAPSPGLCSDSCPLTQWCDPTISSFVFPFSSCFQSFPASGSFPMSWFFVPGGQSVGASAISPSNDNQDWFPLGWTGLISLQSKDFQESSPTPQFKSINSSAFSLLHSPTLASIHDHRKNHSLD